MSATVTLLLSQLRVVRKLLEVGQKKQKNRRSIYLISNEVRVKPDTENATARWLFFACCHLPGPHIGGPAEAGILMSNRP